jgi:hypothetical protein
MGYYDVDDLIIEYVPRKSVTAVLPANAMEGFWHLNGGPHGFAFTEEQKIEFMIVLTTRLQNSLKE